MLRKNFSHTLPVVVTAVLLAAGCLFSCKKKDDTAGTAQFIGEWRGSGWGG